MFRLTKMMLTAVFMMGSAVEMSSAESISQSSVGSTPHFVGQYNININELGSEGVKLYDIEFSREPAILPMSDGLSGFDEFISAEVADNLSPLDKIGWVSKEIFNPSAFNEIVVMNAYPLASVCTTPTALEYAGASIATNGGILLPAYAEASRLGEALEFDFQQALWWGSGLEQKLAEGNSSRVIAVHANPLEDLCSEDQRDSWADVVSMYPIDITSNKEKVFESGQNIFFTYDIAKFWKPFDKGPVGAELSRSLFEALAESGVSFEPIITDAMDENIYSSIFSDTYLLTADPIPDLLTKQVWARCNLNNPESLGSACKNSLENSPYKHHQAILRFLKEDSDVNNE